MGELYKLLWEQKHKLAQAQVDNLRFQLANKKKERVDRGRMRTVFGIPLNTSGEFEKRDNELSDLDMQIADLEAKLEAARDAEKRGRGR